MTTHQSHPARRLLLVALGLLLLGASGCARFTPRGRELNRHATAFRAYRDAGDATNAWAAATRWAEAAAALRGTSSTDYAWGQLAMGVAQRKLGNFERAMEHFAQARSVRAGQSTREDHRLEWETCFGIGLALEEADRWTNAVATHEGAVAFAVAKFGKDNWRVAWSLCRVAVACNDAGDFERGLRASEQRLALLAQTSGARHPDTVDAARMCSMLLRKLDRPLEAMAPLTNVLHQLRKPVSPAERTLVADVAWDAYHLAKELGQATNALKWIRLAVEQAEMAGDRSVDYASKLGRLGDCLKESGDERHSAAAYARADAVWETLGAEHLPDRVSDLNARAFLYFTSGGDPDAVVCYRRVAALLAASPDAIKDPAQRAQTFLKLADAADGLGLADEVVGHARAAVAVVEQGHITNVHLRAEAWLKLGQALSLTEQEDLAFDALNRSAAAVGQSPAENWPHLATVLMTAGSAAHDLGLDFVAIHAYSQVVALCRSTGSVTNELSREELRSASVRLAILGRCDLALSGMELLAPRESCGSTDAASYYNSLGTIHEHCGSIEKAINALAQSCELYGLLPDQASHARTALLDLASAHRKAGHVRQAAEICERVIAGLSDPDTYPRASVYDWCQVGHIFHKVGQVERAAACYENAALLAGKTVQGSLEWAPLIRRSWAQALELAGSVDESILRYKEALALIHGKRVAIMDRRTLGDVDEFFVEAYRDYYTDLAEALVRAGRLAEAEVVMALLKAGERDKFTNRSVSADDQAALDDLLNEEERALQRAFADVVSTAGEKEALHAKSSLRSTAEEARLRELVRLHVEARNAYDGLVERIKKAAWWTPEEFNNRPFANRVAAARNMAEMIASAPTDSGWVSNVTAWACAFLAAADRTPPDEVELTPLLEEYRSLGQQRQVHDLTIRQVSADARYRNLVRGLDGGAAALVYIVSPDRLYLLLHTKAGSLVRLVPIGEQEVNRRVYAFREALIAENASSLWEGERSRPAAKRLYDILIAPIRRDLEEAGVKRLLISPDGALRYIPLAALHNGERYLAEDFSLSLLCAKSDPGGRSAPAHLRVAAMGRSKAGPGFAALPTVAAELNAIVKEAEADDGIVPGIVRLDEVFTKTVVADTLGSKLYPFVLFSTHFNLRPGNWTQSSLLLGDDSALTLDEMKKGRALDVDGADMLLLSACETAMGPRADGSEVESLGGVALEVGAKRVLATLWRIDSEAASVFVEQLFRELTARPDLPPALALQNVQARFIQGRALEGATCLGPPGDPRRNEVFRHPYFWAPFILMGGVN